MAGLRALLALHLGGTRVSDAGLVHLAGLSSLRRGTGVSAEAQALLEREHGVRLKR